MKVYLDSNVFLGAAGAGEATPEERRDSMAVLRLAMRRKIEGATSVEAVDEIRLFKERDKSRKAFRLLRGHRVRVLDERWAPQVEALALEYRKRGAVPPKQKADSRHLAWATLWGADVLASWNRRHLVRLRTRRRIAIIHQERGMPPIAVELPTEVVREAENG